MKRETFVNYKNWFYAKFALVILVLMFIAYYVDSPLGGRKGNTITGLVLGVLATVGILYLTYFGVKKRSYAAGAGNLVSTLSAHIWLGISLIIIVLLHSGFHLGLNVHSLAYYVMVIVILSGIFGTVVYRVLPERLHSQRGGEKPEEMLTVVQDIDADILAIVDASDELKKLVRQIDIKTDYYTKGVFSLSKPRNINEKKVSELISTLSPTLNKDALNVLKLLGKKRELLTKFTEEVRASTILKIWLYLHIPFTCLLLVVLTIHIFLALYYWT